jgi:hypothetical protein
MVVFHYEDCWMTGMRYWLGGKLIALVVLCGERGNRVACNYLFTKSGAKAHQYGVSGEMSCH